MDGDNYQQGAHRANAMQVLRLVRGCLQCFDTVGWAAGRASGL